MVRIAGPLELEVGGRRKAEAGEPSDNGVA
jgi:hypothetical protein